MSRDCGYLRSLHPIQIFDDNVQFYDWIVVDRISQRIVPGVAIDHHTGALKEGAVLPAHCEIANHKYFLNGIPVRGSVTALSERYFAKFDADANATRIAYEQSRCLDDPKKYPKYFQFARKEIEEKWTDLREQSEHRVLLYKTPARHFEEALNEEWKNGDRQLGMHLAFRSIHDPITKAAILLSWERNRDEAGERGTEMHLAIQLWYEKQFDKKTTPGANTKPFEQFLKFHKEWVVPRKLRMLRTELSMFDPYSQLNGTIDAVYVVDRKYAEGEPLDIVLADWKRTDNVKETYFSEKRPEYGFPPFADWPLCKTSERWLQLLIYTKIFTENTGGRYRVVSAHIVAFHDNLDEYSVQDVPVDDPTIPNRMNTVFEQQHVSKREALTEESAQLEKKLASYDATTAKRIVKSTRKRLRDVGKLLAILDKAAEAKEEAAACAVEEAVAKKRRVGNKV